MAIVIRTAYFYLRLKKSGKAIKALNLLKNFQKEYDTGKVPKKKILEVVENWTCREVAHSCWEVCPKMGSCETFYTGQSLSCTWRVAECKDCPSRNYDNALYLWRLMRQQEEREI